MGSFKAGRNDKILVATDTAADAAAVRSVLEVEFSHVAVSLLEAKGVDDFAQCQPGVLILAFQRLDRAQAYYRMLYQLGQRVPTLNYRTIVLCQQDEQEEACELCRREVFDDFVHFWPVVPHAPQLTKAVIHALRDIHRTQNVVFTVEMADLVRRISALEGFLRQYIDRGFERIEAARNILASATMEIDMAIDTCSKKMLEDKRGGMPEIKNQAQWLLPITQLQTQFIHPGLQSLIHEIFPLKQWMENLQVQLAEHLAILHTRGICVPQTLPIVLEVDDNAFDRKVVKQLLAFEYYDLIFAASGAEALGILRKKRPDLILMDVNMPDINGLETLSRLKATPRFANIPVMMLTGQRDKDVVLDCLRKGAIDFVVKPLDPDIFLKKVTKYVMV